MAADNFATTWFRTLSRSARSESLHRLRYPEPEENGVEVKENHYGHYIFPKFASFTKKKL
jgi:hypothetical protein